MYDILIQQEEAEREKASLAWEVKKMSSPFTPNSITTLPEHTIACGIDLLKLKRKRERKKNIKEREEYTLKS